MNAIVSVVKGRGTSSAMAGRFETLIRLRDADAPAAPGADRQELLPEQARSIISRNASPDVPFSRSINPYRGCEHGCIYCYARPSHAFIDLSPGLDFERRIRYKANAAELLARELMDPRYRCEPITIGGNTDPYQPAEAELGITRQLLHVCLERRQPVSIITKSALIQRDADL